MRLWIVPDKLLESYFVGLLEWKRSKTNCLKTIRRLIGFQILLRLIVFFSLHIGLFMEYVSISYLYVVISILSANTRRRNASTIGLKMLEIGRWVEADFGAHLSQYGWVRMEKKWGSFRPSKNLKGSRGKRSVIVLLLDQLQLHLIWWIYFSVINFLWSFNFT